MPVSSLDALPHHIDAVIGAMVGPAGSALRAARAAQITPGDHALVLRPSR